MVGPRHMMGPATFVYLYFKTVLIKREVCEWESIVLHFLMSLALGPLFSQMNFLITQKT